MDCPSQPPPAVMACAGQLNKGPTRRQGPSIIKLSGTLLLQDPLVVESY